MSGFATLTSSTACWHDGAQVSEGPTTHQRNWWCPACGAQRTTFPGDSAEAHFAARTARSQAPAVAHGPLTREQVYALLPQRLRSVEFAASEVFNLGDVCAAVNAALEGKHA